MPVGMNVGQHDHFFAGRSFDRKSSAIDFRVDTFDDYPSLKLRIERAHGGAFLRF